jgi:hypothetical protein
MPNQPNQILASLMVNSALDRAFAAADQALAGRTDVDVEIFINDEHLARLDAAQLPPLGFFVVDCGPGCSRRGKLGPHDPTAVMARTLTKAVAEVVAEGARLEAAPIGRDDPEWSAYRDCLLPTVITVR